MKQTLRKLLGGAGLALVAVLGARLACSTPKAPAEDPSLLDGRVWIEKRPEKHTDRVHAAIFLSRWNLGLFDESSSYVSRSELFDLTRQGNEVKGWFPQTEKKWSFTYTVRACDDLPPFDLCLDLSTNPWGGPKRYHAFRDPDDESSALGARAKAVRAKVER